MFGDATIFTAAAAAGGGAAAADRSSTQAASGAPKRFRYRLVAKCRILTGEGVDEVGVARGSREPENRSENLSENRSASRVGYHIRTKYLLTLH